MLMPMDQNFQKGWPRSIVTVLPMVPKDQKVLMTKNTHIVFDSITTKVGRMYQ